MHLAYGILRSKESDFHVSHPQARSLFEAVIKARVVLVTSSELSSPCHKVLAIRFPMIDFHRRIGCY